MKLKKKSLIFTCLAGLVCVVGTAFAAWQIIYPKTGDAAGSGSLKADTVGNGTGLSISGGTWYKGETELDKVEVNFGADTSGVDSSHVWYANTETVGDSTGTYTYKFNVTVYGETTFEVTQGPTLTVDSGHQNAWNVATTADKPLITYNVSELTPPADNKTGECSFNVTFGWGTAFIGQNPYKYYNDGTKTALTHGSEATANLNKLAALDGAIFTVRVALSTK